MPRHRPDSELTKEELERREYHRRYRAAHKEHLARLHHEAYLADKPRRLRNSKRWYRQNREQVIERARQYRLAHADELKAYWRERKTGCSADLYAALLAKQGGVCAICGGSDPRELCADHDHGDGKVRGLLCRNCNLGIGHLQHDVALLRAAIRYLRKRISTPSTRRCRG